MSKKDKNLSNQSKNEIEEEIAATTVASTRRGNPYYTNSRAKRPGMFMGIMYVFIALLLMGLTALATWLIVDKFSSPVAVTSTSYVEQINELAVLATAEAHVKEVLEIEDNKLFGKNIPFTLFGAANRHLLIIVPATVVAGVDLKEITERDVTVDEEDKMISIRLPRADLVQEPAIDVDGIITYSDEGLFRGKTKWEEGVEFLEIAQEQIKVEANEIGLFTTAEQNAEKALQNFFSTLGYTVNISFN